MSPFAWLFIGHLTGDFLLQTSWMALNKTSNNLALLSHSIIYTLVVAAFSLPFGGLSLHSYALILISHLALDKRSFVYWWAKHITKNEDFWLMITLDQIFHLLILVLTLHI